ncbi:hypothetical protein JOD43_004095 [Pullulanibacillus pueri]|uniref:Spore germination protein n=1 Tax=Pullulanibacillus pueri TaxID=1437324 RepID=A0A8J2ZZQ8_9BACL|nr:hypothetical protein [Pullulanibacillus pueri]MBM7683899.1 hypothetical protein [Pullulanibacillus pueri]GGH87836.1 hypothetical protein GCM10007096_38770 [Pullulanibacillus pueri]
MALNIAFNAVNVNSMQSNAGVFTGENAQTGWFSPTKQNNAIFGTGQFNLYLGNLNAISDNDGYDQPNTDPDFQPTNQNQSL